jgi:sporulation protein YlmC with PRC-barrel domain
MKILHIAPLLAGIAAGGLSAQEAPKVPGAAPVPTKYAKDAARCMASRLIGCEIKNTKSESLGEIQDIVLDNGDHRIAYAVVAFGGFLGMGEKYFALPWRLIEVSQLGTDEKPRATLGLDRAALKKAPGFDKAKWPDMADAGWAAQVDKYYRTRTTKAKPDGESEDNGERGRDGADRKPLSGRIVHRRMSKLIGMDVVDGNGKELADVEDFVIDTKNATIDGALLSFGGVLGVGESLVLVASPALTLDRKKNVFVWPSTQELLESMALADNKVPALNDNQWHIRSMELCEKARLEQPANGDVIVADASGKKSVPYADVYDLSKVETVKGTIGTIGSVRIGDRQEERVRLRIRTTAGRQVIVYAAPATYSDQQALKLRTGKNVEVTGSPARYGSQTVLVAGSISSDGMSVKLRDDKGKVTWSKSKE